VVGDLELVEGVASRPVFRWSSPVGAATSYLPKWSM
jgi:hypothetical protein